MSGGDEGVELVGRVEAVAEFDDDALGTFFADAGDGADSLEVARDDRAVEFVDGKAGEGGDG